MFLGQFNLTEAPHVPELLQDISLITVFVSPSENEGERWIEDAMDGDNFAIRAYSSLEGLQPMAFPEGYPYASWPGTELVWEQGQDFPTCEDPDRLDPADLDLELEENDEEDLFCLCDSNLRQTKVGGYVSMFGYLQECFWSEEGDMRPVLQIMDHPELNLKWGSMSGGVHIFRGAEPGLADLWKIHQEID